jgi:KUP system potassium uptake protein
MESPDVTEALKDIKMGLLDLSKHNISYFLGRESLSMSARRTGMAHWRKGVFAFMSRNSFEASKYFNIPADRLTELGIGVEL